MAAENASLGDLRTRTHHVRLGGVSWAQLILHVFQYKSGIIWLFNPYPANVDNMASSYQC